MRIPMQQHCASCASAQGRKQRRKPDSGSSLKAMLRRPESGLMPLLSAAAASGGGTRRGAAGRSKQTGCLALQRVPGGSRHCCRRPAAGAALGDSPRPRGLLRLPRRRPFCSGSPCCSPGASPRRLRGPKHAAREESPHIPPICSCDQLGWCRRPR